MTKISHIVANGCSFTHGAGLDYPFTQSWPCVLANMLGVNCVNLARSGSGNDRIVRRTYEYFYEDLKNDNNPLYIVAFSGITRKDKWYKKNQCFEIININDNNDYATLDYLDNFDLVRFYRDYLKNYLTIKNLFEAYKIPHIIYLTLDVFTSYKEEKKEVETIITNLLPEQFNAIKNDRNNAGDASIHTAGYPTLPCGHWGIEGNKALANHAHGKLLDLYKDIIIEPSSNYLTNNEYMKQVEPYYYEYYNDLRT